MEWYTRDRKRWNDREVRYLEKNAGKKTIDEMVKYLRRSPKGIQEKIRKIRRHEGLESQTGYTGQANG